MTGGGATTTSRCPHCGADSTTADYCDGCGGSLVPTLPWAPAAATGRTLVPSPPALTCAGCGSGRAPRDAFCEVCGLDFTSGELPVPVADPPAGAEGEPTGWTVVIEADRGFFDAHATEVAGGLIFPEGQPPREVQLVGEEVVLGRGNGTKGQAADIDLSGDPAVSRRHAILRREPAGSWTLIDEGSANGTWVNDAIAPVAPGAPVRLADGDRVRLGAHSMLRLRLDAGTSR